MCGRFALTLPPQAVRSYFTYNENPNFPPRYNIAPTQPVAIVREEMRQEGRGRHFVLVRWGFLPAFVVDPKQFPLVFNARSETLLQKASFRNAMKRRRCLFIADAFYEWRRFEKGNKSAAKGGRAPQPFLFRRSDGAPLAFAGLWETWTGPNGEEVDTACIITTAANGTTAAIHERLPAILEPGDFDLWLAMDERVADEAMGLLRPPENEVLEFFEIGPAVNKAENDGAELQVPLGPSRLSTQRDAPPEQGSLF
jgi:putative SOS response-associated peptidase YedK